MRRIAVLGLLGASLVAPAASSAHVDLSGVPPGIQVSQAALAKANSLAHARTSLTRGHFATLNGSSVCIEAPPVVTMAPGDPVTETVEVGTDTSNCTGLYTVGQPPAADAARITKQEEGPPPTGPNTFYASSTSASVARVHRKAHRVTARKASAAETRAYVHANLNNSLYPNTNPAYVTNHIQWYYTSTCVLTGVTGSTASAWDGYQFVHTHGDYILGHPDCSQAYSSSWMELAQTNGARCPSGGTAYEGIYRNSIHALPAGHYQTYENPYVCTDDNNYQRIWFWSWYSGYLPVA